MITLSKQPNFSLLLSHPAHFLSLGMGAGLAKKAPGTFGTLLAFPLYYFIQYDSYEVQWMVIAVLFVLGVYTCDVTGKALGVSDHGSIVWDEIVAMMLVLTVSPAQWQWHVFAFLLFRLFDIWKPFPIRQFDMHLKGGLGVMFDDLLAALYAIAVIQGVIWIN
jgi:phosphatidylglycerophosphatase A